MRKDNSPLNLNVWRAKQALFLLAQRQKMPKYKGLSKEKMMYKAAMNPEVLLDVLFGQSG